MSKSETQKKEKELNKMKNRIEELEMNLFILSMKDHYTAADFEQERKWKAELAELKK